MANESVGKPFLQKGFSSKNHKEVFFTYRFSNISGFLSPFLPYPLYIASFNLPN